MAKSIIPKTFDFPTISKNLHKWRPIFPNRITIVSGISGFINIVSYFWQTSRFHSDKLNGTFLEQLEKDNFPGTYLIQKNNENYHGQDSQNHSTEWKGTISFINRIWYTHYFLHWYMTSTYFTIKYSEYLPKYI